MIFIPICNLIKNLLQKGLTVALNDNFNLMSLTGCYTIRNILKCFNQLDIEKN